MVLVHLTTGVRELDIVANINKRIICASCGQLSLDPHLMSCGNVLCPKCLTTLRDNACPCGTVCGHPFSFRNFELQVLNLMVKCPNFSDGCGVLVPMRCVDAHLRACEKSRSTSAQCSEYDAEVYEIVDNLADTVCVAVDLGYPFNFETLPTGPPLSADRRICSRKKTLPPSTAVAPLKRSSSVAADSSLPKTQFGFSPSRDNTSDEGKLPAMPLASQSISVASSVIGRQPAPSASDASQSAGAQKPNAVSPPGPATPKCKTHHRKMRENDNLYMDEGVLKLLESGVSGRTRRIQKLSPETNDKNGKRDGGRVSPTVRKSTTTTSSSCVSILKKYAAMYSLKSFKIVAERIPDDIFKKHLAKTLELEKSRKGSRKTPSQPRFEASSLGPGNLRPPETAADGQIKCPVGARDGIRNTESTNATKVSTSSLQRGVADEVQAVKISRETLVVASCGNSDGGQQKPEISSEASPLSEEAAATAAASKPSQPIGGSGGNQSAGAGNRVRCQPPKLVAQRDPKKVNADCGTSRLVGEHALPCDNSSEVTLPSPLSKDRQEISQTRVQKNAGPAEDSSNIQKVPQHTSQSRRLIKEQQSDAVSSKLSSQRGARIARTLDAGDTKVATSQALSRKQILNNNPRKSVVKPVARPSANASASATGTEGGKAGDKGLPERASDQKSLRPAPMAQKTCTSLEEKNDGANRTMSFKIPRKSTAAPPSLNPPPAAPPETNVLQSSVAVAERLVNTKRALPTSAQVEKKRCRFDEPLRDPPARRHSSSTMTENANVFHGFESPAQLRELHSTPMSVEASFQLDRAPSLPTVPVVIPLEPQVAVKENVPQPYQHRLIERPVLELGTFSLKLWRDQAEEPPNSNVKDDVSRCSASPPPPVSQPWNSTSSSAFISSVTGKGNLFELWGQACAESSQLVSVQNQRRGIESMVTTSLPSTRLDPRRNVDPRSGAAATADAVVQKPMPSYLSGGYGSIVYQRGHLSASWLGDAVPETSSFWSSRS